MAGEQPEQQQQHRERRERHYHGQAPKDGRSRMHKIIRDRVVMSKWFPRFVMLVTIVNALVLWPWTDKTKVRDAKHRGQVEIYEIYPVINFVFIMVYTVEFILKVCLMFLWLECSVSYT